MQLLGPVRERAWLLDAVTVPSLVHFDLWEGNVLLTEEAVAVDQRCHRR